MGKPKPNVDDTVSREQFDELRRRFEKMAQREYMREHTHTWRYSRSITLYPEGAFNSGSDVFYEWSCVDERCDWGESGTNSSSNLPDHFPRELR